MLCLLYVGTTLLGKLLLAIACTVLAQARPHDMTAHRTSSMYVYVAYVRTWDINAGVYICMYVVC